MILLGNTEGAPSYEGVCKGYPLKRRVFKGPPFEISLWNRNTMPFCRECGKAVEEDWATCPYCSSTLPRTSVNDSLVMGDVKTIINDPRAIKEGFKQALYEKEEERKTELKRIEEERITELKRNEEEQKRIADIEQRRRIDQKTREDERKSREAARVQDKENRKFLILGFIYGGLVIFWVIFSNFLLKDSNNDPDEIWTFSALCCSPVCIVIISMIWDFFDDWFN
ncbi:MAG: hypothetical protein DWC02_04430 [Candidatus Poseidoniales archaeon]|nr:MAG: hypothetical protein DWC02_04430 [Candidatus Poseidoniales archaeon]